jgi:hypothetical protein
MVREHGTETLSILTVVLSVFLLSSFIVPWLQDETDWLKGSVDERFNTVAKHLRGFDMAMMETGHRYAELYWAGMDGNWGYADYQIKKIRTTVQNGLERRPKRAASAETFLTIVVPALEEAISSKDSGMFWNRFGVLTATCNTCHENEQAGFVHIVPPPVRYSVIGKP